MTDCSRTFVALSVSVLTLAGWVVGGPLGLGSGLVIGAALGIVRWWGEPIRVWCALIVRRAVTLAPPVAVPGGGARYQDGVASAAVRVLGRAHQPSLGGEATGNVLDIARLVPFTHQALGLTLDSLSLVRLGARCRSTGDYPRIYNTVLGPAPYAGRRETWLIVRIACGSNAEALRVRTTAGAAAVAAAERIAAALRHHGIRAEVAGVDDILDLDARAGSSALTTRRPGWHSVRDDDGWLTTYGYSPTDVDAAVLEEVLMLPAAGVIQNVTVHPDGTMVATVTVRTPRPAKAPPNPRLRPLAGRQARAVAANLCAPRPHLPGLRRGPVPSSLRLPIAASGVLLGRSRSGERLLLPLSDPARTTWVHLSAEDGVAKRVVCRAAAAGERVSLHTKDFRRWQSVQMAGVAVTGQPQPEPGTTVVMTDGTLRPAVGQARQPDVLIEQRGSAAVRVSAAGLVHEVEMEMFRAENYYVLPGAGPGVSPGAWFDDRIPA